MIVCCLRGGMGNQIHEYALGRYLSFLTGQRVGVNTFFYGPGNPRPTSRSYELDEFSCSIARVSSENWMERDPIEVNGRHVGYIAERNISIPALIEKVKRTPNVPRALIGFWQGDLSYLDNPEFKKILLREFAPRVAIDPADLDVSLRPIFESETSVGLHVRRTDYLRHADRWKTLGADYYAAALDRIRQTVKTPDIFVFSDDIERVKSEDLFDCPVTYVETGSLHTDFHLFRTCRHNVIANSTFSWWSGYLNPNPDQQIVAPRTYYATDWRQAEYESNPRVHTGWHMI